MEETRFEIVTGPKNKRISLRFYIKIVTASILVCITLLTALVLYTFYLPSRILVKEYIGKYSFLNEQIYAYQKELQVLSLTYNYGQISQYKNFLNTNKPTETPLYSTNELLNKEIYNYNLIVGKLNQDSVKLSDYTHKSVCIIELNYNQEIFFQKILEEVMKLPGKTNVDEIRGILQSILDFVKKSVDNVNEYLVDCVNIEKDNVTLKNVYLFYKQLEDGFNNILKSVEAQDPNQVTAHINGVTQISDGVSVLQEVNNLALLRIDKIKMEIKDSYQEILVSQQQINMSLQQKRKFYLILN